MDSSDLRKHVYAGNKIRILNCKGMNKYITADCNACQQTQYMQ